MEPDSKLLSILSVEGKKKKKIRPSGDFHRIPFNYRGLLLRSMGLLRAKALKLKRTYVQVSDLQAPYLK